MTIASLLLSVLLLAVPAGAARPAQAEAEEKMPVFMMSQQEKTCVRVEPGQTFALRFQGRPGTGFSWAFAVEPDKTLLEFLGETAEGPGSDRRVGGGENFAWTFRALAVGTAEVAMKYARSWETDVPPLKTHVFRVTIAAAGKGE
jgi:predicted secreted protein